MAFVDGFVIAVPKSKLDTYKAMARQCEPIWREFGAIDYVECAGDDTPYGEVTSFPRAVQAKDDETVIFSWIVYPDRTTRDGANKKGGAGGRRGGGGGGPPGDGGRGSGG